MNDPTMQQPNYNTSIVIPTLNEEGFIEKLLEDCVQQKEYIEIIISDSGSKDATQKNVEDFIKKYPSKNIRYITAQKKGVATARNNGVDHAKGEYIIFLDADTRIPKDFFKNAKDEIAERKLNIAGFFLKTTSKKMLDKIFFILQKYVFHIPLQYTKHPACAGAGIMVKKDFHHKIGGFSEELILGEDTDYLKKGSKNSTFRMLTSTHVIFSMRRFEDEGRLKLLGKYLVSGLYYLLNLDMKKADVEYEFGKFSKGLEKKKPNT